MYKSLGYSLYNAKDIFIDVCPGPMNVLSFKYKKVITLIYRVVKCYKISIQFINKKEDNSIIIGKFIGESVNNIIKGKFKRLVIKDK